MTNEKMICENGHIFTDDMVEKVWCIGECIYRCPRCKSRSIAFTKDGLFDLKRRINIELSSEELEMLVCCNWSTYGMLRLLERSAKSSNVELSEIDAKDVLMEYFGSTQGSSIKEKIRVALEPSKKNDNIEV